MNPVQQTEIWPIVSIWFSRLIGLFEFSIYGAGVKVEISLDEEVWRDVWFPATVVEDFGNGLFLVEYNCSGIDGELKLCRVTVDHLHIRPSVPQIRVTSFGLLEKVDAFVDFGWWSGVITKKLADSRYLVYFKHTNKAKELSHLELRPHVELKNNKRFTPYQVPVSKDVEHDGIREISSLNLTNTIEDTTSLDKQTSTLTSMKRAKPTNRGSSLKPSKKSKADITSDDPRLSNGGQSNEASNPAVGQTLDKAENLSSVKKKLGKRAKDGDLKRPMSTSAKNKGRSLADSRGPETLSQAAGDSTLTTTPSIVEKKHVTQGSPIPVILGLRCYTVTVSQSKKPKQVTSKSPQNADEPEEPQSGVPLAPKATGNQERKEMDGVMVIKKKRGRPFKTQPNNLEISVAVDHHNGDASVTKVPYRSGIELPLQQKYDKPVKGKRGKRRMISLNSTSSQDVQVLSKQKENESSEINVEKSLDTVSDDQPLSKWFSGKQSLPTIDFTGNKPPENSKSLPTVTNGDGQTLTFEKRSSLWETIESMEAFRLFPQNPHFRPLDNIKESARERHAINKMVDFSGVFEDTRRLRIDNPRTQIDDHLETLLELETHGFDIDFLRNRLMELISFKDKQEGLESQSKEVKVNIDNHRVEVQKLDKEIESIDKQVADLLEKRDRVSKEKENKDSEIVGLETEIHEIEEGLRECRCKFDELATASLV